MLFRSALTWWDRQGELQGTPVNTAEPLGGTLWRVVPKHPVAELKDLRRDTAVFRNRDMAWDRQLDKMSAERHIGVVLRLDETDSGLDIDALKIVADGVNALRGPGFSAGFSAGFGAGFFASTFFSSAGRDMKIFSSDWYKHKFLKIKIIISMRSSIDDIHEWCR